MIINLPWPDKKLSPNARVYFKAKNSAYQSAKSDAYYATKKQAIENFKGNILLKYIFHFPNDRQRDLDNCLASCKAYQDGIALALEINDNRFRPIILDRGENVKDGQVEVCLA